MDLTVGIKNLPINLCLNVHTNSHAHLIQTKSRPLVFRIDMTSFYETQKLSKYQEAPIYIPILVSKSGKCFTAYIANKQHNMM